MDNIKKILIVCAHERQALNGGIDIANRLQKLGHEVLFLGPDIRVLRAVAETNGFRYHGFGRTETIATPPPTAPSRFTVFRNLSAIMAYINDLHLEIATWVKEHSDHFDLIIIDVLSDPMSAYFIAKMKKPQIIYCSGYSSRFSPNYPPANCSRLPNDAPTPTLVEKASNLFWWFRGMGSSFLQQTIKNPIFLVANHLLLWKAKRAGSRFCLGEWGYRPDAPEIALAFKPIDWQALQQCEYRFYLGRYPKNRQELTSLDWRKNLHTNKPIVYASIGAVSFQPLYKNAHKKTLARKAKAAQRYLSLLVETFANLPRFQLVIAANEVVKLFSHTELPENVLIHRWVPQDEVLAHSSIAITLGGSSTVRDCVHFGVPMIVFPFWTDHYGNAVRVARAKLGYHGGNWKTITPAALASLVESLYVDEEVRHEINRAHAWARNHLDSEEAGLVQFVKRHTGISLGEAGSGNARYARISSVKER